VRVALLGRGRSIGRYVDTVKNMGGRSAFFDEVWAVNTMGDVCGCDRIFLMDDVRGLEARAKENPSGELPALLRWLKRNPGPIYTSRPHPDYAGLVEYPLDEVVRDTGFVYFTTTVAYAIAYAIHLRTVKVLSLFGLDFTYPDGRMAERGRACAEFWLGVASQRGIRISIPSTSSLMESCAPQSRRLYGYELCDVEVGKHAHMAIGARVTDRAPELAHG